MKKLGLISIIPVLLLASCSETYTVKSDFNFQNDEIKIADTLSNVNHEKAHVVFLYGQSNAEGETFSGYLEAKNKAKYDEYLNGYDNVMINFYNHGGIWTSNLAFEKCTLGAGVSKYCFGPETGIAEEMHNAYPQEKTFIIKWAYGGSALRYNWLNNHQDRGDLYNYSMDFSRKCLDYLISKGYEISIHGICWMQGESDSYINDNWAYYRDTVAFATLLRHDLKKYQEEIRFVDATINEDEGMWLYPKEINWGKKRFSKKSDLNYLIDTNALGIVARTEPEEIPDYGHYDSESMVKLGQEFGKIVK